LTANLAVAFSRSQRQWDGSAKPAVAALKRFVAENYGNGTIDLVGLVLKLIPGLAKLNFSAFGLSAEVQWKPEEKQVSLHVARSLQRLMHSVGFCLQNAGAVILLDHLDDSWDGSPEAHDMLVGLLKAAKRLNDLHPMSNDRRIGLKVIVFLRSDIYSRLHFDDNDKHRPLEEPLVWTDVELVDMIDKRLPGDMTVLDIVAEPRLEYMLERTFMRPREVIQFFGECFRVAPRSATELTLPDIIKAEEQYSRWKVADLRQEFARSFPDFGDLVECLRLGPDRYESYAELIVMIGNRKYRLVKDYGERAILETLFDASVLGYKASREDKAPTFRCDNDDLTLPGETTVFVHKGLHKGLNIQQRRSWRMSYGGMRSRS